MPRSRDLVAGSAARRAASPVAYAASMFRASWLVTTAVVSSSPAIAFPWLRGRAGAQYADDGHRDHHERERAQSATSELVAALASVRIHLYLPGKPAIKAFTMLMIMAKRLT